ncbi:MAG: hypothetical protein ACFFD8_10020, partial [Candidatus Thorarchaeota archaeon]
NKLEKRGAILEYMVELSLEMLGLEPMFVDITTNGTEDMNELLDQIGKNPWVRLAYRPSHQRYQARAYVAGTAAFFELKRYLESLEAVIKVELHPTMDHAPDAPPTSRARTRGRRVTFTRNQLCVLKCLTTNVRMPISEIAKRTSLTSGRVRKVLHQLQKDGGVYFTIRMDYLALGDVELELFIRYDDSETNTGEIVEWFYKNYRNEFWVAAAWQDEPVIDVMLIIENPSIVKEIISKVRGVPFFKTVEDQLVSPQRMGGHYRDPTQERLGELFREAGL